CLTKRVFAASSSTAFVNCSISIERTVLRGTFSRSSSVMTTYSPGEYSYPLTVSAREIGAFSTGHHVCIWIRERSFSCSILEPIERRLEAGCARRDRRQRRLDPFQRLELRSNRRQGGPDGLDINLGLDVAQARQRKEARQSNGRLERRGVGIRGVDHAVHVSR